MSSYLPNQEPNMSEKQNIDRAHPRDHLANERTFLAWIRTSIGIMAFGFVVEKFALFIKQMAVFLAAEHPEAHLGRPSNLAGYSSVFGIFLVAFGVLICLLAFIKYKKVEKQIEDESYRPSTLLNVMLTLAVVLVGIFLIIYLNRSVL